MFYSRIQVDTFSRDDNFVADTGYRRRQGMQVDTTACIRCKRSIIHIHCDSLNHNQLVLLVLLTIATGRLRLVLTARWCHDDVKGSRHGDVIKTVFQPIICNSHPFIPSSSSSSCVTWPVPDPPNSAALLQWYWERQSPPSQDMTFYIMSDWHDHTQCVGLVTKPINMERGAWSSRAAVITISALQCCNSTIKLHIFR